MSKIAAIASRQRDWRTRAKSEIAIGRRPPTPAIRRSWVRPVPFQCDPSTTRRSAISSRSFACGLAKGGSSGHQIVTGRSWMSRGAITALRCRPDSPPIVRWIVSAQVSGASARGTTQWAVIWASSQDGPSGSAGWTIVVRDG